MADKLAIEADWETLDSGSPEERACFAALGIRLGDIWLTEAEDRFVNRIRNKVHLSAYRLAEWLAWNWWRLRWEPETGAQDWPLAHRMTTIGGGYVWPNITIYSDIDRIVMVTTPTERRTQEPLRYLADRISIVRTAAFEDAVERFIEQVRGQLRAERVATTTLDRVWDDVRAERQDPASARRRKFEALLGADPDEAREDMVSCLLRDASALGEIPRDGQEADPEAQAAA